MECQAVAWHMRSYGFALRFTLEDVWLSQACVTDILASRMHLCHKRTAGAMLKIPTQGAWELEREKTTDKRMNQALLEQLKNLIPAQFAELLYCCELPPAYLPANHSQVETAIALLRHVDKNKIIACLEQLSRPAQASSATPTLPQESSPPSEYLRFLHLSDLHFTRGDMVGADWAAAHLQQDAVNRSLLEALEEQLRDKPLDFVIITGDIAFSGKREEYTVASEFFQGLKALTGLPANRFFPIAGNHDVDRTQVPRSHRKLYRFDSQEDLTDTLSDPDFRPLMLRKFAEFNDFAEQLMGTRHFDETTYHFTKTLTLDKNGHSLAINLLGLNSALLTGFDGDEQQGLALGMVQVEKALAQLNADAPLSLGFFHHPFALMHAADKVCEHRLKHQLDLILYGHLHQAASQYEQGGAGESVLLSAGAAYASRHARNGFNLVEVDVHSGQGAVHFFKYLANYHCWNRDNDVCPHEADGVFRFALPRLKALMNAPRTDTPAKLVKPDNAQTAPRQEHFIHNYLLPDHFTGRAAERQRLQAFLSGEQEHAVLAVCALGGMGKSCLARQGLADLPDHAPYQQVVWFSFYEARTEDEAYAFREILRHLQPNTPDSEYIGTAQTQDWRVRLCQYLKHHPVLLVLDGLEVIQHTNDIHSPHYGHIIPSHQQSLELIRHACNHKGSRVLITTRVPLADLDGAAGFDALDLPVFSTVEAAEYLRSFDIQGGSDELEHCAELFGGHPLCLRAAGKQMQQRHLPAREVERLIGNKDLFRRSSEGARVAKIIDSHREDLTPAQEHFLKMLSLHPRSVTQQHFPALVQDYEQDGRDQHWVEDEVIYPLEKRGLLEVLAAGADWQYTAHPLMKLAFAAWLNPVDVTQAHEHWAKAAEASPALTGSPRKAKSLEELQPWLDVIEHYLAAHDWAAAWEVYRGKEVDRRLMHLAYARQLLDLGVRFEQALEQGWGLMASEQRFLYGYLAHACFGLERLQEFLDYQAKAIAVTQTINQADSIVAYGALLTGSYASLGNIQPARTVLKEIKTQAETVTGFAQWIYQSAQAKMALCSGDYQQAIALYETAIKNESNDHNRIGYYIELGETQYREGFPEAQHSLQGALQAAERHHIPKLLPAILARLTWLALAQHHTQQARDYNDRRVALKKSLNLPGQTDDEFLLIAEGAFQQALTQAHSRLDEIRVEGLDKAGEIKNLLILSQAQQGLGEQQAAQDYQDQAKALMQATGCWREKNRLSPVG